MVGKPYEVVLRLHAVAGEHWREFDGDCALQGIDPLEASPRRFCNLIYAWLVKRVQPENREEFDMALVAPLPGRSTVSPQIEEDNGAAFMALLGATGGRA